MGYVLRGYAPVSRSWNTFLVVTWCIFWWKRAYLGKGWLGMSRSIVHIHVDSFVIRRNSLIDSTLPSWLGKSEYTDWAFLAELMCPLTSVRLSMFIHLALSIATSSLTIFSSTRTVTLRWITKIVHIPVISTLTFSWPTLAFVQVYVGHTIRSNFLLAFVYNYTLYEIN
jgi:hypothetical protein